MLYPKFSTPNNQGFETQTRPNGLTINTWNRIEIRFFKIENRVYMSSERTGRTGVQPEKPNEL